MVSRVCLTLVILVYAVKLYQNTTANLTVGLLFCPISLGYISDQRCPALGGFLPFGTVYSLGAEPLLVGRPGAFSVTLVFNYEESLFLVQLDVFLAQLLSAPCIVCFPLWVSALVACFLAWNRCTVDVVPLLPDVTCNHGHSLVGVLLLMVYIFPDALLHRSHRVSSVWLSPVQTLTCGVCGWSPLKCLPYPVRLYCLSLLMVAYKGALPYSTVLHHALLALCSPYKLASPVRGILYVNSPVRAFPRTGDPSYGQIFGAFHVGTELRGSLTFLLQFPI